MKNTMIDPNRNPPIILHKEGKWELQAASNNRFNVGGRGWKSVIKHTCKLEPASHYWMLLEHACSPTRCFYCSEPIPESIVCLFKLQNWECIR